MKNKKERKKKTIIYVLRYNNRGESHKEIPLVYLSVKKQGYSLALNSCTRAVQTNWSFNDNQGN